jgi:hypothetical protein
MLFQTAIFHTKQQQSPFNPYTPQRQVTTRRCEKQLPFVYANKINTSIKYFLANSRLSKVVEWRVNQRFGDRDGPSDVCLLVIQPHDVVASPRIFY